MACGSDPPANNGGAGMGGEGGAGTGGQTVDPRDVMLAPPEAGKGFQFATEAKAIPAGTESQDCYFYQIPGAATEEVYVHRVDVAQNIGSHHMNMFRVKTIKGLDPANGVVQAGTNGMGECFKSPNWADWPLIINSQTSGVVDWTLPTGVAHKFNGGDWIMLQTHYVNGSTQTTPTQAKVLVNYWTTPKASVTAELGTLFATNQSLRVCQANPTRSFDKTCHVRGGKEVNIVGANGHFHGRGTKFDMFKWDGTSTVKPDESARFYTSLTWDEPPMMRSPELDLKVPAGGGIWYTCDFQWVQPPTGCAALNAYDKSKYMTPDDQLDCCYTFGGQVDLHEHCNAFVYYWPKDDTTDIFCN
jgi:hypothetical protein